MLKIFRARKSNMLVWALLVLIFVGLAGFGIGIGSVGIGTGNVARVGDTEIESGAYARALESETRAISQRLGRNLTMEEARQYGIDRVVLGRLVNDAALDAEAARLGLSTGDEAVRAQVVSVPAFQGADGKFDRDAYAYALKRTGLSPTGFESLIRKEAAREAVAAAVQAPVTLPDTEALTVLGFLGERRSFDWLRLDADALDDPVAPPTDAEVQSQYDTHQEQYSRPETRKITYASVTPESLAKGIDIPEDDLRAVYDAAPDRFVKPERRILDRIGFPDQATADAARARLDAGEIGFDALATERGLKPEDIDQGSVAAKDLSPEAADAVFGAAGPGIVGPVDTPLGPSLYRVDAVLAASTTSFEEARATLRDEKALDEAKARIANDTAAIEDLVAGGATVEEIADETAMEAGKIDLNAETTGGLADDAAFRQLAADARQGEETDVTALDGGGLVTLRVDAVEPAAVLPLDQIRDRVATDAAAAKLTAALTARADDLGQELSGGLDFQELGQRIGVPTDTAGPITRGDTLPGAPPDLVASVFAAQQGGTIVMADGDGVILAQLSAIDPFDPDAPENAAVLENVSDQYDTQARDDVLALYTAALRNAAGVRVNQDVIDSTIARFP